MAQRMLVSSSGPTGGTTEGPQIGVATKIITYQTVADGQASDEVAYNCIGKVPVNSPCTAIAGYIVPLGSLTANDTNYKTIYIQTANSVGVANANLFRVTTKTTGSGDWSAGVVIPMPVGVLTIEAGEYIGYATVKSGSGVALPAFLLILEFSID